MCHPLSSPLEYRLNGTLLAARSHNYLPGYNYRLTLLELIVVPVGSVKLSTYKVVFLTFKVGVLVVIPCGTRFLLTSILLTQHDDDSTANSLSQLFGGPSTLP
jgi:hypothetical protein